MPRYEISTKNKFGNYRTTVKTFNDEAHYLNYCKSVEKGGGKVIGSVNLDSKYYLFGENATHIYDSEGIDELLNRLGSVDYDIHEWIPPGSPNHLLLKASGWGQWMEITREDYLKILKH